MKAAIKLTDVSVRDFDHHLNNVKEVNGHSVASPQMAHASQKLNKMKAASEGSVRTFWDYDNGMCNIKVESEGSVSSSQITSSSRKRFFQDNVCNRHSQNKSCILVGSSTFSGSHQSNRNHSVMSHASSPNCRLGKRKNESSVANDHESYTVMYSLSNGTGSFSFNNKIMNMNVNENVVPPRQLEFITKSIKSPNEHEVSVFP